MEVGHSHGVRVIPARSGRTRRELIAAPALRRDEGGALLLYAVDFGWDEEAVPMDEFGYVGVVDDVHGDWFALAHAEHRPGRDAVVADGAEDASGCELHGHGGDAQGVVGLAFWGRGCGVAASGWTFGQGAALLRCLGEGEAAESEKVAPLHKWNLLMLGRTLLRCA